MRDETGVSHETRPPPAGVIKLIPVGSGAQADICALMRKYHEVPMAYADACLLWLAESIRECRVLTLDSDFAVYRLGRARLVPLGESFG